MSRLLQFASTKPLQRRSPEEDTKIILSALVNDLQVVALEDLPTLKVLARLTRRAASRALARRSG